MCDEILYFTRLCLRQRSTLSSTMATGLRSGRRSDNYCEMDEKKNANDDPQKGRLKKNQDSHVIPSHQTGKMKNLPWPRLPAKGNKTPSPRRGSRKPEPDETIATDKQTSCHAVNDDHHVHFHTPQLQDGSEKPLTSAESGKPSNVVPRTPLHENVANGCNSLEESSSVGQQMAPSSSQTKQSMLIQQPEQQQGTSGYGASGYDPTTSYGTPGPFSIVLQNAFPGPPTYATSSVVLKPLGAEGSYANPPPLGLPPAASDNLLSNNRRMTIGGPSSSSQTTQIVPTQQLQQQQITNGYGAPGYGPPTSYGPPEPSSVGQRIAPSSSSQSVHTQQPQQAANGFGAPGYVPPTSYGPSGPYSVGQQSEPSSSSQTTQIVPTQQPQQQQVTTGYGAPGYVPPTSYRLPEPYSVGQQSGPSSSSQTTQIVPTQQPQQQQVSTGYGAPGYVPPTSYRLTEPYSVGQQSGPSSSSQTTQIVPTQQPQQQQVTTGYGAPGYGPSMSYGLPGPFSVGQQNAPTMTFSGPPSYATSSVVQNPLGSEGSYLHLPPSTTSGIAFSNMDAASARPSASVGAWTSSHVVTSAPIYQPGALGSGTPTYGSLNSSNLHAFSGAVQQNMPMMLPSGLQMPIENVAIGGQPGTPAFYSMQYPMVPTHQAMCNEFWPSVQAANYDYNWPPTFSPHYATAGSNNFVTTSGEDRRGGRVWRNRTTVRGGGISASRGGGRTRASGYAGYGRGYSGRGGHGGVSGPSRRGGRGGREDNILAYPNRRYNDTYQVSQGNHHDPEDPRLHLTGNFTNCYGSLAPAAVPQTIRTNANCFANHRVFPCRHHHI